jgi:response regulator RpfG family c-di-GMP phosphodiesterase
MAARIPIDAVPADAGLPEARLRAERHEIRIAPNGADALRLARSEPVDLVVRAVSMPGLKRPGMRRTVHNKFTDPSSWAGLFSALALESGRTRTGNRFSPG